MSGMPGLSRMSGMMGSLRPSSDVTARELLVNDGSEKKKFNRKPVVSPYSWQDVTSVLIKNIPGHVATKDEIVKELETLQQTFITFGM